jgi:hypothetical protein
MHGVRRNSFVVGGISLVERETRKRLGGSALQDGSDVRTPSCPYEIHGLEKGLGPANGPVSMIRLETSLLSSKN